MVAMSLGRDQVPAPRPNPRQVQVGGFSLVEVLVAVLVLSIGLLGLAGLQIAAARANDGARLRTEATLAASDVADRLRADPSAFFPLGQASKGTVAIKSDSCGGGQVGTQDAQDAIARWKQYFCGLGLPPPNSGDFARVDCRDPNACGGGNCAIVLRWDDRRGDRRGVGESPQAEPAVRELLFCTRIATAI